MSFLGETGSLRFLDNTNAFTDIGVRSVTSRQGEPWNARACGENGMYWITARYSLPAAHPTDVPHCEAKHKHEL